MNLALAIIGAIVSFTIGGVSLSDGNILAGFVWLVAGGAWVGAAFTSLRVY